MVCFFLLGCRLRAFAPVGLGVSRSHGGVISLIAYLVSAIYEAIHRMARLGELFFQRAHIAYSTIASDPSFELISFRVITLLSRPPTPIYSFIFHYSTSILLEHRSFLSTGVTTYVCSGRYLLHTLMLRPPKHLYTYEAIQVTVHDDR